MNDYYALLGVQRTATSAEIKTNFRLLATKFHPDKNSDPDASEKFIAISEAYEVLRNKKRRAQYDLYRYQELKQRREAAESFTVVTPPQESTRTRRNRVQKKRSIVYHQTESKSRKRMLFISEGFRIAFRYIHHLIGIILFAVILGSMFRQLAPALQKGILPALLNGLFLFGVMYVICLIGEHFRSEFRKDIETFEIFYRTSVRKPLILMANLILIILVSYIVFISYNS